MWHLQLRGYVIQPQDSPSGGQVLLKPVLSGVPDDGLVSWVAFLTEENLRELVQGGVSGDFDDVRATMNELEDQMREGGA
jgi:hypothetical protein